MPVNPLFDEDGDDEDFNEMVKFVSTEPKNQSNQKGNFVEKFKSLISKPSSQPAQVQPPKQAIQHAPRAKQQAIPEVHYIDVVPSPTQADCDFIDVYLDLDVLQRWFDSRRPAFVAQIFPQFFVQTLTKFKALFDQNDEKLFHREADTLGDLNNPSIRDRVYSAQSEILYSSLLARVQKKPSLIKELIAALRVDDWYPKLADSFEAELNIWRKQMHSQIATTNASAAAAFHPSGSSSSSSMESFNSVQPNVHPNQAHQAAQAYPPLPTSFVAKPRTLLHNIPEPISYFVQRSRKSDELLSALRGIAKQGKGWLILHGMGGSGKTVLAASTVRKQHDLDPNLFSDGIYWLNIGNLHSKSDSSNQLSPINTNSLASNSTSSTNTGSSSSMSDLANQLLLKMELLAEFVRPMYGSQQFSRFDQIDSAMYRLKRHFEQFKRSLLILDDVWSMEVLERFQFGIPVLVTTRESTVCPRHFINIRSVPIVSPSGDFLSIDESLALLRNCLPSSELVQMDHLKENYYVVEILKQFNLPFCVPLIANCMEIFYRLAEESPAGLRYKLMLQEGDDELEDKDKMPCYAEWAQLYDDVIQSGSLSDTKETHKLVKQSIQSLDDALKERLYDFVIFFDSVPFAVFQTLWSDLGSDIQVMEVLMKLVAKSLIIKTVHSGPPSQAKATTIPSPSASASFTLHNITYNFLRTHLHSDKIKERHGKLIDAYLYRYCRTVPKSPSHPIEIDYSRLPNDNYIYHSLAYHLYSADRRFLFAPIFLNLRFAANKIAQVGPSDLLNDYIDFQRFFEPQFEAKLADYHSFIASNSNVLCEPNVDILQIALCQPDESHVYKEAAQLVANMSGDKSSNRAYFNWTNKHNCSMEAPPKLISFKCLPEVNYATYSPDSRHIATISGRTLQIWNGITGEMITRVDEQHHEQINHCVFSRNGQYLLTSGDDGLAIMWQNLLWLQAHPTDASIPIGISNSNRNSRSYSCTAGFDLTDSFGGNHSAPSSFGAMHGRTTSYDTIDSIHHPTVVSNPEQDALYIQAVHQQRRRRSSGNSGHPTTGSPGPGSNQQCLSRHVVFDLKSSKLKSDTISESSGWSDLEVNLGGGGSNSLSKIIKCGDISPDNRLVLTGNGTGNLHLWSVADAQQIISPLAMNHEDEHGVLDESGKMVECCSFSSNSHFALGLVSTVVYIYSITDNNVRSHQELNLPSAASSPKRAVHFQFHTPPQSPRSHRRRDRFQVQLVRKLIHPYKVYNALFHSSGFHFPAVFTSSDKYIFEWDLDPNQSRNSFLDSDDETDDGDMSSGIKMTVEKRKYSLCSQQNGSNGSSSGSGGGGVGGHLSFAAVSQSGKRIAGFEHTRNEIYLWSRGNGAAGWGFGSRSPSPVGGSGCSPYSTSLRCHSNIVTLCFSADEERLLGCCRSGEITVWEIGKNVKKTSIVDLKKKFAVSFSDESNDQSLNILTIDTKGFLRLFSGLAGDENKSFSMELRQRLLEYRELLSSQNHLGVVDPFKLDITSCDIATNGEIIFGTSLGDVFYFDPNIRPESLLRREQHGSVEVTESVFDCEFITKDPENMTVPMKFVTLSDQWLCVYTKQPSSIEPKFEKKSIQLSLLINRMNNQESDHMDFARTPPSHVAPHLESFRLLHRLYWIIFWSNSGHLFVFDYRYNQMVHSEYLGDSRITSVDFSDEDPPPSRRSAMIVSTCDMRIHVFKIQRSPQDKELFIVTPGPRLPTLPKIPRSARIAPNKTFLIVGDDDGGLTRRSTESRPLGEIVWHRKGAHTAWVHDLIISSDHRFLLSASESVKLWNALDGTLLQTFMTHGNVNRLLVRFPTSTVDNTPTQNRKILDNNNNHNQKGGNTNQSDIKPTVTVVTVTDASTLYILRTFD